MLLGYVDSDGDTPTSTPTSSSALQPSTENILRLVKTIDNDEMSVKEMLEKTGLKDRKNFLEYSLNPAINEGFVQMKYPNSPRHPRQRYLLTVKGLMLLE